MRPLILTLSLVASLLIPASVHAGNGILPQIVSALNQQHCEIASTGMIANIDMGPQMGGMISTAEVICKDRRAMAARLSGGKVEIIQCKPGQSKVSFSDGTGGDYCPR